MKDHHDTRSSSSLYIFRFPMDLDVRCKATLIGAVFLIDYMFFEKEANKDSLLD